MNKKMQPYTMTGLTLIYLFIFICGALILTRKSTAFPHIATMDLAVQPTDSQPYLIAHRGLHTDAPENSAQALHAAGQAGFWGSEFDLQRTMDGVWVLMHDATTKRMMEVNFNISKTVYADLLEHPLLNAKGEPTTSYILTFSEALEICKNYNMNAIIEIKDTTDVKTYAQEILTKIHAHGMQTQSQIISFSTHMIKELRKQDKDISLAHIVPKESLNEDVLDFARENSTRISVEYRADLEDSDIFKKGLEERLIAGSWTVNDNQELTKLSDLGIKMVTTDYLLPKKTTYPFAFRQVNT